MNKILASKLWWLILLIVLIGFNYLASVVHTRVDLTQEKRYTLSPATKKVKEKAGEAQEERLVFPGALVKYRDREVAVDLLQGQDMTGGIQSLNNAEALLEYKMARSIQKITADTVPAIGYLVTNQDQLNY